MVEQSSRIKQTVTSPDCITWTLTSFLDTVAKTVLPHDLRGDWMFVGYTTVPLGHGLKSHPLLDTVRFFEIDFIHALLTRHMKCLSHIVMLNVCFAIISES